MFNNVKLGIAPIGWTNDDMPQLGGELTFEQMVPKRLWQAFRAPRLAASFRPTRRY